MTDFEQAALQAFDLEFVPPADVIRAYEDLTDHHEFPREAMAIANYFEDAYIGRMQRRRRQAPMFPIDLWNVYQRTLEDQQRTNNDVEGWHRGFQETCATLFPNIFRFIDALKKQQGLHNFEVNQLIAGHAPNPRNKKYASIAARVKTIIQDYANRDIIEYLHGIAYNFEF